MDSRATPSAPYGDDDACFSSAKNCFGKKLPNNDNGDTFQIRPDANKVSPSTEMKEAEQIIAAELTELSIQERAHALDDLHCVGSGTEEEDPKMVQRALDSFEEEVQKASNPLYNLAISKRPDCYLKDSNYRMRFLRVNHFHVSNAVRQMLSFLEYRAEYFGNETLHRELEFSDLNKDDVKVLTSGMYHFQLQTDRSGRYIVYCFNKVLLSGFSIEALIRSAMYAAGFYCAFPDVDKKGIVAVYVDVGDVGQSMETKHLGWFLKMMAFAKSIPLKYSGLHYCVNTTHDNAAINRVVIGILINTFPSYSTVRTRLHYGSIMELRYSLQSHGIPMQEFPIDSDGNILQKFIDKSCRVNYRVEFGPPKPKAEKETENIKSFDPRPVDILLGRGKRFQNHPGNVELRSLVEDLQIEYDSIRRIERRRIVQRIKQSLSNEKGARFLKQDEGKEAWILAESAEADEKIRQHFRCGRKKK